MKKNAPENLIAQEKSKVKPHHTPLHPKHWLKYPKFLILILSFVIAYLIFAERNLEPVKNILSNLGYLGTFIAGIFYTYGFSSLPASAIFLILGKSQNIFISAIIGGFGALIGDLIIFKLIRTEFDDEIRLLKHGYIVKWIDRIIPTKIKHYLAPIIGVLIIASPLPDEIGVSLIAVSKHISQKMFITISYTMNTLGIFILLWIGNLI